LLILQLYSFSLIDVVMWRVADTLVLVLCLLLCRNGENFIYVWSTVSFCAYLFDLLQS